MCLFKRRGEIKPGPNGSTLIDDSFNANRQSILAIARAMHDYAASLKNRTELEAAKRAAAQLLKEQGHSEDLILFKASLGLGMDTLLAMLQDG